MGAHVLFLCLQWLRNVQCALGLGGFLGRHLYSSNRVAGGHRRIPARWVEAEPMTAIITMRIKKAAVGKTTRD